MRRAVLLLSGGLDSATAMAIARAEGYEVHALCFRYGQRHAVEIAAARAIAERQGAASFRVVEIDLRAFGGSALTSDLPVPKATAHRAVAHEPVTHVTAATQPEQATAHRAAAHEPEVDVATATHGAAANGEAIPITYVPARNSIFLAFALAAAETLDARDIFIGVNAVDYSGYPDCRPEFIAAFERMANFATRAGVEGQTLRVHAPLMHMTKAQIIQRGLELGVDYALTTSCYDPTPDAIACGLCDACRLRRAGFAAIGRRDPIRYLDDGAP